MAFLAFERYIVICKPFGNFRFTSKHALMVVAATWVIGIGVAIPPFFGWSRCGGDGWGAGSVQGVSGSGGGHTGGCQEGAEPPSSATGVPWGATGVPQGCPGVAKGVESRLAVPWRYHGVP